MILPTDGDVVAWLLLHSEDVEAGDLAPWSRSISAGDCFRGSSGNRMIVEAVEGGRVLIGYVDDPEDNYWEDAANVERFLRRGW